MNFTGYPIPLPLDPSINRCLAHGAKVGEWCERRESCACHETINHDRGIYAPTAYRKCSTDKFASYLPIEGFPIEDEETCSYPKCNCPFDAPADPNWCARGLKPKRAAKYHGQPEKTPETETTIPAIVFFPSGSLGEEVQP